MAARVGVAVGQRVGEGTGVSVGVGEVEVGRATGVAGVECETQATSPSRRGRNTRAVFRMAFSSSKDDKTIHRLIINYPSDRSSAKEENRDDQSHGIPGGGSSQRLSRPYFDPNMGVNRASHRADRQPRHRASKETPTGFLPEFPCEGGLTPCLYQGIYAIAFLMRIATTLVNSIHQPTMYNHTHYRLPDC